MNESHGHYVDEIHGAADQHHRHYDLEQLVDGLREDLNRALERISGLEDANARLAADLRRQAELHADVLRQGMASDAALAVAGELSAAFGSLAASLAGRHGQGCDCAYCSEPEPEEYDPGPEVDDEGGMSEYRHAAIGEEPW